MHLFCPACGKHIDVSIEEIENLQGQLVCPQCLESIEVNMPSKDSSNDDSVDIYNVGSDDNVPPHYSSTTPPASEQIKAPPLPPSTTAQAQPPSVPKHTDAVMRYCKKCGAFLREGANFCPKCGSFVKVVPPPHRPAQTAPPPYRTTTPSTNIQPSTSRHMATSSRKNTHSSKNFKQNSNNNKFSIYSTSGCFIITLIAVAIFFIAYIVMGINLEG